MSFFFPKKKNSHDLIKSVEKNLKELSDAFTNGDKKAIKKVCIGGVYFTSESLSSIFIYPISVYFTSLCVYAPLSFTRLKIDALSISLLWRSLCKVRVRLSQERSRLILSLKLSLRRNSSFLLCKTLASTSVIDWSSFHIVFHNFCQHNQPSQVLIISYISFPSYPFLCWFTFFRFEFESRKDIGHIITCLFRHRRDDVVAFLLENTIVIETLTASYEHQDIALTCGAVLRELLRSEDICRYMLYTPTILYNFLDYVQLPTFDVASDAFSTFKTMMTKHKKLVCQFLNDNFDTFFARFNCLLQSESYVTKRLSLKLLAELLLSRDNFTVMMRFINVSDHLKLVMNLLRGTTKAVQLEAFHVFKIFVANPKKSPQIEEILFRNRVKLIDFLTRFQKDKDDEQFNDEKNILLNTLTNMETPLSMRQ